MSADFKNWLEEHGLEVSDLSDSVHGLLFKVVDEEKLANKSPSLAHSARWQRKPYRDGFTAARFQKDAKNPHPLGSQECLDWYLGFEAEGKI